MQTKKVLIITYYWPPSGGAGVQRWLKFVKYLPDFGWQPIVYTPENPEAPSVDESLMKDIPSVAEVIKTPIWEPYTFYKKFTGKKQSEKVNAGFIEEKKSNKLLEKVSVFIRGNFFIPDARKFWIKPSVKYLSKYIKENNIDTVISSGPPHSMHLIALKLKKKLDINWLADFRDPWTNIDFYDDLLLTYFSDRKHKRLEKQVLKKADTVITVGKTMADELRDLGATNVEVITNGFDHADIDSKEVKLDEKFTILHAGSLNKDRNHPVLWEALENISKDSAEFKNDLEIKLIGKVDHQAIDMINAKGMAENINKIDYIPHNQISTQQKSARVLYLPINNTPNAKGILTGKFFEYLAAQRPILTIGMTESDVADIVKETQAGKVIDFSDVDGVQSFISREYEKYKANSVESIKMDVEKYSRKSLTEVLSVILSKNRANV